MTEFLSLILGKKLPDDKQEKFELDEKMKKIIENNKKILLP